MASVTLTAGVGFDISTPLLLPFFTATFQTSPILYEDSSGANNFSVGGTNLNQSQSTGRLIGGTVNTLRVDLDGRYSIAATSLSVDAALLGPVTGLQEFFTLTPEQGSNLIWRAMLGGSDIIDIGAAPVTISIAGDGRNVEGGQTLVGGYDVIVGVTAAPTAATPAFVTGDYATVEAFGLALGGADFLSVFGGLGARLAGDADVVFGSLFGGWDTITGSGTFMTGDVHFVGAGGSVYGGNDAIYPGFGSTLSPFIVGDVAFAESALIVSGGADRLIGGQGADFIYGDVYSITGGGTFVGGDDDLFGFGGADILHGDFGSSAPLATSFGGADSLYGGAGDDILYGNGGNDWLQGGQGFDTLFGDSGFTGFTGFDTASYLDAPGGVSVELFNFTASQDGAGGSDFLYEIEAVVGSAFGDVILGDGVSNVLDGYFGADLLFGGFGNDFIIGGNGSDYLQGDEGFDTFFFASTDFTPGSFDFIGDFSESATSFDVLSFSGLTPADLSIFQAGTDTYIYVGPQLDQGIVVANFAANAIFDQLTFA